MNLVNILIAALVLGVTGAAFGLLLAVAARAFRVDKDEREDQILELLPGANCGGCGYPGCGGYTAALLKGEAKPGACSACSSENNRKIGEILGVSVDDMVRMVAQVRCTGGYHATKRFRYLGIDDCASAARLGGGPMDCSYGCVGLGSCIAACKFDALKLDAEKGVARVNRNKCTGCMACAKVCPKGIITAVPYDASVAVRCMSQDKGAVTRKYCEKGCIGCRLCEKVCETGAIKVVDNVASIDYAKCTKCGKCAEKCPRKIIEIRA